MDAPSGVRLVSVLEVVRQLARGALGAIEAARARIDDLNVYPVPDGDTGTNLTLTVRAVVEALDAATPLKLTAEVDPERLRPTEVPTLYGSRERITGATGWEPEIPLAQSLADILDYWRGRVAAR